MLLVLKHNVCFYPIVPWKYMLVHTRQAKQFTILRIFGDLTFEKHDIKSTLYIRVIFIEHEKIQVLFLIFSPNILIQLPVERRSNQTRFACTYLLNLSYQCGKLTHILFLMTIYFKKTRQVPAWDTLLQHLPFEFFTCRLLVVYDRLTKRTIYICY